MTQTGGTPAGMLAGDEITPAPMRAQMLKRMRAIVTAFYWEAFQVGCHPFVEWCGLMSVYLDLCQFAQEEGTDFTAASEHSGRSLPLPDHKVRYFAEKFSCIFGPTFRAHPEAAAEFFRILMHEAPGASKTPWAPDPGVPPGGFSSLPKGPCDALTRVLREVGGETEEQG